MAPAESTGARGSTDSVELAKYLWEEYKYRHDLIWRLLFRLTFVAAFLSIVPFTIDDLTKKQSAFGCSSCQRWRSDS